MLLIAAFIWGTAFVAQSSAAESIEPFTFTTARSFVGALFLVAVIYIKKLFTKSEIKEKQNYSFKQLMLGGSLCGAAMFIASNLQQMGITAYPDGVASSGRAGFITAMYVVLVALCGIFSGKKLHPAVLIAGGVAVLGMYLLCLSDGVSGIYLGDVLVFLCAVGFTAHILIVDKFSFLDGIKLSCIQFLVCGTLCFICALIFESPDLSGLLDAWFPIFYAGVMSSGIAFTLQIVGQKYAEPAVASIVMSLESVFAGLGGWVILNERLSSRELLGCVIVFAAVILAQTPQFKIEKTVA